MVGAALCTGGTGFEIGSVCLMYCLLCFNHASFNSSYVWKLTIQWRLLLTVVMWDLNIWTFVVAVQKPLLCCEDGMVKHFTDWILWHFMRLLYVILTSQIVSKMRGPSTTTSISRTIASIWHLEGRSANQFLIVDFLGKQKVSVPRKTRGDVKCVQCEERI